MTKYYTAIGKFIHPSEGQRNLNPSVVVGNNECLLDPQELIIWASLSWRFLKLEEIGKYYEKEASVLGYTNDRSWQDCLNRLIVRGLVVCGSGETDYDALYDLLSPLFIIPLTGNVAARVFTYAKLTLLHRIPAADVKPLIKRDKKTQKEKHMMKLVQQAPLTVGELVRCVDKGIHSLDGNDSVMDLLYDDTELTSDNIGATVKYALCCQDVTITVANLYLRQQLIFDRV